MKSKIVNYIPKSAGMIVVNLLLLCSACTTPITPSITPGSMDAIHQTISTTLKAPDLAATQTAIARQGETQSAHPPANEVTPPEPAITATQDAGNGIPDEHYIVNISGHRQYYGIGCEASAVTDWAAYFGVNIVESHFQFQLPLSDNPDYGFVGLVTDPWGQVPPYSYGVHAYPVANLLRSLYGMNARGLKGFSLEQLKAEVAANRPVIAWVIGNMVGGIPYKYIDKEGREVIVAAYEHVVIITGYSQDTIRYLNNGKFFDIPNQYFENSWSVLGNMVVILEPPRT